MKKYNYTEAEAEKIANAKKSEDKKAAAKVIRDIRKKCTEEGRFEEVEKLAKKSEEETKQKPKRNSKGQFVSSKDETEEETTVEVHGAKEETSVVIP